MIAERHNRELQHNLHANQTGKPETSHPAHIPACIGQSQALVIIPETVKK